ncbi:DJ-1/PfpI family protein [Sinimarinibacterium sp. CAU 1509]|uniref:DJ-1 family glyoxalase III n=1 Tax=Sinimarinibacterium sp. CAU 1509 TaxID=2562283 RepID=UPI0010ACEC06|nr:DJ-1 family glyoxalase III [Sinimarinibacterium sp. CAU 1509]TJY60887.1 DJ-1/PfpI family protein [Sinimarinibacterium sp. CAU 1509]
MKAMVAVAEGSESLETVTVVNVLRRAGFEVTVASITGQLAVKATREITLTADALFADVAAQTFDLIVLPGGETGARTLGAHAALIQMLNDQRHAHRWTAAICAAPALALAPAGLLDGKQATCYPAFRDALLHFVDLPVVVDGHCITSQGPATAMTFALQLVESLAGSALRKEIAADLLHHGH